MKFFDDFIVELVLNASSIVSKRRIGLGCDLDRLKLASTVTMAFFDLVATTVNTVYFKEHIVLLPIIDDIPLSR
jgi:hypothetical protein